MAIHYVAVDVTAVSAYPADPQVILPFAPKRVQFINDPTATEGALISMDGTTNHAYVGINGASKTVLGQQNTRIWLKRSAAGANVVHIIAEDTVVYP